LQSFKKLKVWEKAHTLTLDVYRSSRLFPREEMYGLTSQMRRASASIGANIAEGACRSGDCEFRRFLTIAMGSAGELEYHPVLAHDLQLLAESEFERLSAQVVEVKRMLASLLQKLTATAESR